MCPIFWMFMKLKKSSHKVALAKLLRFRFELHLMFELLSFLARYIFISAIVIHASLRASKSCKHRTWNEIDIGATVPRTTWSLAVSCHLMVVSCFTDWVEKSAVRLELACLDMSVRLRKYKNTHCCNSNDVRDEAYTGIRHCFITMHVTRVLFVS